MNALIQLKKATSVFLIALGLACFGLSLEVQAVSPAPDGSYPGFTTAEGDNALLSLTTGAGNTGIGWYSLATNSTGNYNTAVGAGALDLNTADSNTAVGAAALLLNTAGTLNTAMGTDALVFNTTGNHNTATGAFALFSNTTGIVNTANGVGALQNDTTGSGNTAIGEAAGFNQTTGGGNVYIGSAMFGVAGESNACYIASIFGETSANGIPVLINSNNKLGTATSSKRFKEEIKPMDKASQALFALKPVTFRYKKKLDPQGIQQWGLVAEDVQRVNPALVALDKEGRPYSVRYDAVNAMLLNEFLKAHRRMEEQDKRIEELTAQLKRQAAQIQKVGAQLELSKSAPQTVVNNQ